MEKIYFKALYVMNTVPLVRADNLATGEMYFTDEGDAYLYKGESVKGNVQNTTFNGNDFKFMRRTPLMSGEKLSKLTNVEVLRLFWVLSKNM